MSDVRLIAFYFPQLHPTPENDARRNDGFAAWGAVTQARANFVGHYQPHLPGELGCYDLRRGETHAAQAELARAHGIYGFCYYYYGSNRTPPLQSPLDEVMQTGEPDFPFCVCWANPGSTGDSNEDSTAGSVASADAADNERRIIEGLLPLFADRRYMRVRNRPLLLVDRPDLLSDPARAAATCRDVTRRAGIGELYLACIQHPGMAAPDAWGFDAAVEKPPSAIRAQTLTEQVQRTNPAFAGTVLDYISAAQDELARPQPTYRWLRGVMTAWDNTPKAQDGGQIFVNSHPRNYERWLAAVVAQARRTPDSEERIVFINAWNGWGEGCHLEPDVRFGRGYLEATRAALGGLGSGGVAPEKVDSNAAATPASATNALDDHLFVDTLTRAALGEGLITGKQAARVRPRGAKPMVVVAGAPKSGTTFLCGSLIGLTGLPSFRLCAARSTNEHDLYLPALCLMSTQGCVSQLHMKGTFHNAKLMEQFGIRPILLVRRIEDIVVSLQHDLQQKALLPTAATGAEGYSFVWQDQFAKDLSEERRLDMIIDLAVPWFVNFYVSWYRLCEQGAVDALWLTYEQMMADKEGTLRQVLRFLRFRDPGPIPSEILTRKYGTFRDGRVGQSATTLSHAQRARIRALFAYYPSVDFARYGIMGSD
jgi:hypothetical protein